MDTVRNSQKGSCPYRSGYQVNTIKEIVAVCWARSEQNEVVLCSNSVHFVAVPGTTFWQQRAKVCIVNVHDISGENIH